MRIKYCLLALAALPLLLGPAAPASAGPPHYRVITEPQAGYQPVYRFIDAGSAGGTQTNMPAFKRLTAHGVNVRWAWSGVLWARAAAPAAPAAPTMLSPRGQITLVSAKPTFRWTKVGGARSYELRVYQEGRLFVTKAGLTGLSWQRPKALPRNVDLVAHVRAVGTDGAGAWSKGLGFKVGIDYADRAHWLVLPSKPLKKVDVFYVYPSSYVRRDASAPILAPIDDPGMLQGARQQFSREATAFRTFGSIYSPRYRQADAQYALSLPPKQRGWLIGDVPASDVIAAFSYYIEHYNHGRPFILAGHSQGSQVLEYLLARYMKHHPSVYKRMIAAYVVGYSITRDYLDENPFLKFTKGGDDTGVIVSWNTEAPTIAAPNPVVLPGGIAVNPITWTLRQTEAAAAQNLGSIEVDGTTGHPVLDANGNIKRVKDLADARVDKAKGIVICSTIDASQPPYYKGPGGFPEGVLHPWDYPLYFFDVRANAADRVARYFAEHPEAKTIR